MRSLRLLLALVICLLALASTATEMPSVIQVPPAAQPSAHFDPVAATDAYLAEIPPSARAKSDAYFEGGYWLQLWDLLYGAVVALMILGLGWSAAMRNFAERVTRFSPLQTAIYWAQYCILVFVLGFPLAWYEGYFREHQYGLATQTFGPWAIDQFKDLLINIILVALLVAALFGIVRKMQRTWWIWGALVTIVFMGFVQVIFPIYLLPMFNKITRLTDPVVTQPILRLARANGIPVKDVFQVDASRQTTRMSANVSGFGRTMRITLNDNLLRRGSPQEIQAVMGHEMGHYVLNHVYMGLIQFGIVIVFWFIALRWSLGWALARWGEKWRINGITDVAVLPLVVLLSSIFFFVTTPVVNTIIRTQEAEADMYGLNASREPDGFAQAAIHLAEYRKMSPGPIEEWMFYDHPSGRNRILAAMRWKAENLPQSR